MQKQALPADHSRKTTSNCISQNIILAQLNRIKIKEKADKSTFYADLSDFTNVSSERFVPT
ncbi:hypothetical protein [Liquorilactobacillus satsumensis]|uniref:hypothetical protein n=1 Tax=Liquorilactobacillus satsumensis TaxID=259059 RepID=UPI0039EBF902